MTQTVETKATLDLLTTIGVSGADCLTEAEVKSLGDLTLNELRALGRAQKLMGPSPTGGGVCGGKIF